MDTIEKTGQKQMNSNNEVSPCRLCKSEEAAMFFEDTVRMYYRCQCCKLVFVPKMYWLSAEAEKATYDLHQNNAQDAGYRAFLSRLSIPLLERLAAKQQGLDFGCGPGPTLSVMLEKHGHKMDLYDPLYFNDPSVFAKKYDFICATEVVEHLRDPDRELTRLLRMLKPGGWLGIMTKLVRETHDFSQWHYIRDMTHICFYSENTFAYLAQRFNTDLKFLKSDVILLHKR